MVIYKTTNNINGKIYVGKKEWDKPEYLGSGYILKIAIEKYGRDNFTKEIIEECNSREELKSREKHWIKELNATDPNIGYNIAEGGNGGNTYLGKTEEEMMEIKAKISKTGKGRIFSEEHKKKLAESAKRRKGNKPSKFKGMKYEDYLSPDDAAKAKEKLRNANLGKKLTEEHKTKIGTSSRGRVLGPMSEDHKENLKNSFIERDKKRTQASQEKNILILNKLLIHGVNEENVNYARRIYQKVRSYGIDMNKYDTLVAKFKEIEYARRSNRKTLTNNLDLHPMNLGKMKPFIEHKLSESVVIRTFSSDIPEEELKWHWDEEHRRIEPLNENDWQFQFDNCLPEKIYKTINIPAGAIHRVIKGSGNLIVKITKHSHETHTHI